MEELYYLGHGMEKQVTIQDVYEAVGSFEAAHDTFLVKVKQYSKLLDVKIKKLNIKNMKRRWGAITKQPRINLNINLIKAPEEVIDYIIIHELCHFMIKGHSHHFWGLVRSYFPRYQDL